MFLYLLAECAIGCLNEGKDVSCRLSEIPVTGYFFPPADLDNIETILVQLASSQSSVSGRLSDRLKQKVAELRKLGF